MDIQLAVERLNLQLPLKARQEQLPAALKVVHCFILYTLAKEGRAPNVEELQEILGEENVEEALQRLSRDDLVVLDHSGRPVGAYPITLESTPHRIRINAQSIYAMCALDAVSVAPMFKAEVEINSLCHVTHEPVSIRMRDTLIQDVSPSPNVLIGVRWQMPTGPAAYSMCTEMVFLKDHQTAEAWQAGDTNSISLFTLEEAMEFGSAFFMPLLE